MGLNALILAATLAGCGRVCVVDPPRHLHADVIPARSELRTLLARTGAGVLDSLPAGVAAARFRVLLSDLDRTLATVDAPAQCRSFNALAAAMRALPASSAGRERIPFELALSLTAASIAARQSHR